MQLEGEHEDGLNQLEMLYSEQGEWTNATGIMRRKVEILDQQEKSEDALELLTQVAVNLLIQVQDKDAASATFTEVLERDPANLDASYQLEQLCEDREAWDELAALLLGRIDHLDDKADRIPTLHKLASVYETRLEDPVSAFLVIQRAVGEEGEDPHSLAEIERLASATEEWDALVDTWKSSIPTMEDAYLQGEYWIKLGTILRDKLDRLEEAVSAFANVLDEQPEHAGALEALVELHAILEDWPALITTLEAQVEVTPNFTDQVKIAVRVGEIYERQMGDADAAVEAYKKVLELDERADAALDSLERLYTDRGQWNEP